MTERQIYQYKSFYRQLLFECEGGLASQTLLVLEASWKFERDNDPNDEVRLTFNDKGLIESYEEKK